MNNEIHKIVSYYWSISLKDWLNRLIWKGYQPNYYLDQGVGYIKDIQKNRPKYRMIYFHGTNGNIYHSVCRLSKLNINTYYVEYPGYSDYSTYPSIDSNVFIDQIKDVIQIILNDIPYDEPIILYCRSIGSGVLFDCLDMFKFSKHCIYGIILETPFKSLENAVSTYTTYKPAQFLCYITGWKFEVEKILYNNISWFFKNDIKFMFIAGKMDTITPSNHVEDMYKIVSNNEIKSELHIFDSYDHCIPFDKIQPHIYSWLEKN